MEGPLDGPAGARRLVGGVDHLQHGAPVFAAISSAEGAGQDGQDRAVELGGERQLPQAQAEQLGELQRQEQTWKDRTRPPAARRRAPFGGERWWEWACPSRPCPQYRRGV